VQIQQLSIKVFARTSDFDQEPLIAVFHGWIRKQRLGDVLLIDVADYRHVPGGPGVMLIGHEGHYGLDTRGGELGLCYSRKRDAIGPARPRLSEALGAALRACHALQGEPSLAAALDFDPGQLEVRIMSRLAAPQDPATYEAFAPVLREFFGDLYGGSAAVELEHMAHPAQPFGVRVRIAGEHDLAALAARL
jgi:hypothetical protein